MALQSDPIAYPPRGMSREEAARYVGFGTTKFDQLVADGRMPKGKRVDGRVVWDRFALDLAFNDLGGSTANSIDALLAGDK
jgi:predicted DNA-binding transcriptional regulator AlpA